MPWPKVSAPDLMRAAAVSRMKPANSKSEIATTASKTAVSTIDCPERSAEGSAEGSDPRGV